MFKRLKAPKVPRTPDVPKVLRVPKVVNRALTDPRFREAATLLVRFAAAELVVRYVQRIFFVKWIALGVGALAAMAAFFSSGFWWVIAAPALTVAALVFVVAWWVERTIERWAVPDKLRRLRLDIGDIRETGLRNVRAELGRAGLPTTVFGLLGVVRKLSGRSRREVPAELWEAVKRVDIRRILPNTEPALAVQRLAG